MKLLTQWMFLMIVLSLLGACAASSAGGKETHSANPAPSGPDGSGATRAPEQAPSDVLLDDPAYSIALAAERGLPEYFPSPDDWRDEVLYQLLTDRFYDGDPSNNTAHPRAKFAPKDPGALHGGDFKGIQQKLPYLKELGVTAIWISPVQLNSHGQYHGYHTMDFARIDPHWGTLAELQELIREAHKQDIRVIIDVICNHLANIIDPVGEGRKYRKPPATYQLRWKEPNLRYPAPFDDLKWFHAHGPIDWDDPESVVLGELYGLDDLKTEDPQVREWLATFFKDLIAATDCDGFRVDTTKHVEADFWYGWCRDIHRFARSLGKENFFIFGEAWEYDVKALNRFLVDKEGGIVYDSLLDFPGQRMMTDAFAKTTSTTLQLRKHFEASTEDYALHAQDRMVRFLDNHDGMRFLSSAAGEEGAPGRDVLLGRLRLGLAFLMTTGGVPVIYYGTEQGFDGIKNDRGWSSSREDMFDGAYKPTSVKGDSFDPKSPLFQFSRKLVELRAAHSCLRKGTTRWLRSGEKPGVAAYTRENESGRLLMVFNNDEKSAQPLADIPIGRLRLKGNWSASNLLAGGKLATYKDSIAPQEFMILELVDDSLGGKDAK